MEAEIVEDEGVTTMKVAVAYQFVSFAILFLSLSQLTRNLEELIEPTIFSLYLSNTTTTPLLLTPIFTPQISSVTGLRAFTSEMGDYARTGRESTLIWVGEFYEFEGELKARYQSLAARERGFRIPMPMYIGMFAGSTKPKPFQRKRPNLSNLPAGKLPPLSDMRQQAVDLHRGSFKPCEQGSSRRVQIAMQHIHEGYNTFQFTQCVVF